MLDRKGVIYRDRPGKIDQWKSKHAINTKHRTLEDAIKNADVGLSAKDVLKPRNGKIDGKKINYICMRKS